MPEEHPATVKHMQGAEEGERERLESERSIRGERDSKKDVKEDALMIGEEGGEGEKRKFKNIVRRRQGRGCWKGIAELGGGRDIWSSCRRWIV